jgi:hypothetical protein
MATTRQRIGAIAAGTILAGAGLAAAVQTDSYAASCSGWRCAYGPGVSGHAGYNISTNHGWVCDDKADGLQVYAVWYFNGTSYRANAPAHADGCGGNWFTKYPTSVKVCINYPYRADECGQAVNLT